MFPREAGRVIARRPGVKREWCIQQAEAALFVEQSKEAAAWHSLLPMGERIRVRGWKAMGNIAVRLASAPNLVSFFFLPDKGLES